MNKLTRYRVTYTAQGGPGKGSVTLSEIGEWPDLETALHESKAWAEREGWILKSLEELES